MRRLMPTAQTTLLPAYSDGATTPQHLPSTEKDLHYDPRLDDPSGGADRPLLDMSIENRPLLWLDGELQSLIWPKRCKIAKCMGKRQFMC